MPEIPDFAAVSATVEAAKICPNKTIAKVVNGVLRNLIRRRGEFEQYLASAPLAERESYPNALIARWTERFGDEKAAALAAWHNTPAETWIFRRGSGYEKLSHGARVASVRGYAEGEFIVQDPSTNGAVELLDLRPGLSVLDFCAAPGGKTARIAWILGEKGRVTAQEVNPRRLVRLEENLARLGLQKAVDAVGNVAPGTVFDRVLADVPCSNTGVLRRRPDARWRWNQARLDELNALQDEVLSNAARHVAPGGVLVHSTCSIEPEENEMRIEAFLASHPDFARGASIESLPFESGHDGAYACALLRHQAS